VWQGVFIKKEKGFLPGLSQLSFWSLFLSFLVLGFELRALHLQSRCLTAWATPPLHFALVILEVESLELFAWAGLKPWSSQSQAAKTIGVKHWHQALLGFFLLVLLISMIDRPSCWGYLGTVLFSGVGRENCILLPWLVGFHVKRWYLALCCWILRVKRSNFLLN
jgi:hypothetical protein